MTGEFTVFWLTLVAALRVGLGCVFLVSGTGKLWDLQGTRQALSDFGVPDAWVLLGTRALPVFEVLLGSAFLFDPAYRLAAAGGTCLAVLFVVGIANLLRQGRTPPCHCFGAVSSAPVGVATLVRAIVLGLGCFCCACAPSVTLFPANAAPFLAVGGSFLTISLSSNVVLWKRAKGSRPDQNILSTGQRLPALRLVDGRWLSEVLALSPRHFIIVTSAGCRSCQQVKTDFRRWRGTVAEKLTLWDLEIQSKGKSTAEATSDGLLALPKAEYPKLSCGTPTAYLVDKHGVLLSSPVFGEELIEALLRQTLAKLSS